MNTCPNSLTLDLAKLTEFCYIQQIVTGCLFQHCYYLETLDKQAVLIDPLRDIEPYLKMLEERNSKLKYVFLTHFHADFISGHYDLALKTGAEIVFGPGAKTEFKIKDVKDNDIIELNDKIHIKIMHTPGHTLESSCFLLIEKGEKDREVAVFTGDTLFIGDAGRPDLAVDSTHSCKDLAELLFESLQRLKKLESDCVIFPGHGAGSPCGKNIQAGAYSTVEIQLKTNYALSNDLKKEEFVEIATANIQKPPDYFFHDALMNRKELGHYEDLMKASTKEIEVDEFEKLGNDKSINVIDSRSLKLVYETGTVKGAVTIPLESQYAIFSATIFNPKNKTIVICEEGKEKDSLSRLIRVGFDNILGYLKGGITAWISKQKPISSFGLLEKDKAKEVVESGVYTLDIRNKGEHLCPGHYKTSQLIPLPELQNEIDKVSRTDKIYLICKSGVRAAIAASLLRRNDFNNTLLVLEGGMTNLIEKGLTVEK